MNTTFDLIKELNVHLLELSKIHYKVKDESLKTCLFNSLHNNYIAIILYKLSLITYKDVQRLETLYENNCLDTYIKVLENLIDKLNVLI